MTLLDNQIKLAKAQIEIVRRDIEQGRRSREGLFTEMTIEDFVALPFISSGECGSRSAFAKKIKEYKISKEKEAMIKVRVHADKGELDKMIQVIKKANKKTEMIPYYSIIEYLESIGKKDVFIILILFSLLMKS